MTIQISSEFPLIHQIAFSSTPDLFVPNKYSLEIKRQFGDENYQLWDLEATRKFLKEQYPISVVSAFDYLQPYAYKSDLARYCIINYFGGIYADMSIKRLKTFSTLGRDMVIFRDGNSDRTNWKAANGFFYSKPNNPILSEAVEQVISNVRNKYYGHDPHFPTGPSVFGRAIAKYGTEVDLLIGQDWWLKYRNNKFVLPGNQVVARDKRGGAFNGGISGIVGGNNYNEMWLARTVFAVAEEGDPSFPSSCK
jgi:mannosyltransferase OCH1-like enzyme